MKIYDSNPYGLPVGDTSRTTETQSTGKGGAAPAVAGAGAGSDRVELSGTLGKLSQALNSYQTGNSARVAALAAQYQSGRYQPDSLATSRAMVSDALSGGLAAGLQ